MKSFKLTTVLTVVMLSLAGCGDSIEVELSEAHARPAGGIYAVPYCEYVFSIKNNTAGIIKKITLDVKDENTGKIYDVPTWDIQPDGTGSIRSEVHNITDCDRPSFDVTASQCKHNTMSEESCIDAVSY